MTSDGQAWGKLTEGHRVVVSCMLTLREWSRGFGLSSRLLRRLAVRGIGVDCSIYFVGGDDVERPG